MGVKGVLIIIGIVALSIFVTFVVEEIRFKFMHTTSISDVKTLQEENQALRSKLNTNIQNTEDLRAEIENFKVEYNNISKQIKTLRLQFETRIEKDEKERENLKKRIDQLETAINKIPTTESPER